MKVDEEGGVAAGVLTRHTYLNGMVLSRKGDAGELLSLIPNALEMIVFDHTGVESCIFERRSGAVLYIVALGESSVLSVEWLKMLLEQARPCEFRLKGTG